MPTAVSLRSTLLEHSTHYTQFDAESAYCIYEVLKHSPNVTELILLKLQRLK